jgi:hypothetical protein
MFVKIHRLYIHIEMMHQQRLSLLDGLFLFSLVMEKGRVNIKYGVGVRRKNGHGTEKVSRNVEF